MYQLFFHAEFISVGKHSKISKCWLVFLNWKLLWKFQTYRKVKEKFNEHTHTHFPVVCIYLHIYMLPLFTFVHPPIKITKLSTLLFYSWVTSCQKHCYVISSTYYLCFCQPCWPQEGPPKTYFNVEPYMKCITFNFAKAIDWIHFSVDVRLRMLEDF